MKTKTVNISFQETLINKIDEIAREESRTRSDLIREAARLYIERKKHWQDIFAYSKMQVKQLGLKEDDIEKGIVQYRNRKSKQSGT